MVFVQSLWSVHFSEGFCPNALGPVHGVGSRREDRLRSTRESASGPVVKRAVLTPRTVASINDILDYNWDDELEDAADHLDENPKLTGHIFVQLVHVHNWLHNKNLDPFQLVKKFNAARGIPEDD